VIHRLAILVLGLTLVLGVAACGGDDNGNGEATDTDTTEETTTGAEGDAEAGRTVFIDNCGECHTLSDAETTGAVGPNLDGIGLSAADIENQVRNGGGVMPAFEGTLSEEDISNVVAYVSEASSG
jgi:mono/diheme cytochrome c family protein